ncbi:succinate dehydrogenase, hydrophobic membrane anchor protein [Aquisediminimonas sediminicola]|uniref:succinate dehydrogenase, hydrophobic membrane anchor protein n=1 Tax=Alteraquisediminimonas sediminicola TaxID=2676787 RepID=UPI001C8EB41E|nr:succinate dehydrogenase, hydrophobic membrane anchor protein [Aquisediminimonas sediminicola]
MGTGTGIGRVRGLGSAKSGAHHWVVHRFTAIGNLLLAPWLLVSLVRLPDLGFETVTAWLSSPFSAVAMLLFVVSTFWHLRMGLQVVIEDYVHDEGNKFASLLALNFSVIAAATLAVISILKIAVTGGAA